MHTARRSTLEPKARQIMRESGFMAGAQVLTLDGYRQISDLNPGARVITRRGMRVLRAVTTHSLVVAPVRIGPMSLGFSRPAGALLVMPEQAVVLRDWRAKALYGAESVIVPVSRLIDGEFIRFEDEDEYLTYDLHFDMPEIINLDGVEMVASVTLEAVQMEYDSRAA